MERGEAGGGALMKKMKNRRRAAVGHRSEPLTSDQMILYVMTG